ETTPESVYRVRILDAAPHERVHVENVRDRAKIPVPSVQAELESDLLYPYVTGTSVTRWHASIPGTYVIPHTRETGMKPLPENRMREEFPLTYEYFMQFKSILEARSIHKRWGQSSPFYSLYVI